MLLKANTDVQQGTIVTPDGSIANKPTIMLSAEDAALLRTYRKFLERHRLREALFCDDCWDGTREDGCKAFVQTGKIGILCRCKTRLYFGMTY